jgi:hypothetical protein
VTAELAAPETCVECGAPMMPGGAMCEQGCHVFVPMPDGTGECVNCVRAEAGAPPVTERDVPDFRDLDEAQCWDPIRLAVCDA